MILSNYNRGEDMNFIIFLIENLFNLVISSLFYVILIVIIWRIYNSNHSKKLDIKTEYKEQRKLIKRNKSLKFLRVCFYVFLISTIMLFISIILYFLNGILYVLTVGYHSIYIWKYRIELLFSISTISFFIREIYINSLLNKFLKQKEIEKLNK